MKKVLLILPFLCILTGAYAQVSVKDFYARPNPAMSGETFTFHFTVVNDTDGDVNTTIYLRGMSDPEKGFYEIEEFKVAHADVHLTAEKRTQEFTYNYSITTEDEYFRFFFRNKDGGIIGPDLTVQIGNCGNEVERVEFTYLNSYGFVDSIGTVFVAIYPASAPRDVEWIFGDPGLVEIVEHYMDGTCPAIAYKGLAPGETTLTARTPNGLEATIPFVVYKKRKPAESLTLNMTEIAGDVGDTFQLEATIEPDDVEDPLVLFVLRDDKVATVGLEDGLVELVGPGSTEILAWVSPGGVQASCQVMVEPASALQEISVDELADVYAIDGTLLLRQAASRRINALPPGSYILRYPDRTHKIIK